MYFGVPLTLHPVPSSTVCVLDILASDVAPIADWDPTPQPLRRRCGLLASRAAMLLARAAAARSAHIFFRNGIFTHFQSLFGPILGPFGDYVEGQLLYNSLPWNSIQF